MLLAASAQCAEPAAEAGNVRAPAINMRVLEGLRELDPAGGMDLAMDIMRSFIESAGQGMDHVEKAIVAGNSKVLGQAAHALKSSAANVGTETLSDLYRQLEKMGRENRIDEARALLDRTKQEHDHAVSYLQTLLMEAA